VSLRQFLGVPDSPKRSLLVVNRTEPEPFQILLEAVFERQGIAIEEETHEEFDDDTVLLVAEDGEIEATSPLKELQNAILMVNSDLFITGTVGLDETDVPDVIDGLAEYQFYLRGYPKSNKENLLLILISRSIEQLAFEHDGGTLRTSFQRLSRIDDERGTYRVYQRLSDSDVDVHVYGRPDWTPAPDFPVTMHGGHSQDFRDSWFVVFTPPETADVSPAALLAIEQDQAEWEGYWTYQEALVEDIAEYIRRNL